MKQVKLILIVAIISLALICCTKKTQQKTDRQVMYESYPRSPSSAVKMRDVEFVRGEISHSDMKMLQILNDFQFFVQRKDVFSFNKYKDYFKSEYVTLSSNEKALLGKWMEWDSVSRVDSFRKCYAFNGDSMWFLPNKKLLLEYQRYEKELPLIAVLCDWKIDDSVLMFRITNIVYANNGKYVNEKINANEWEKLYNNISDIDWTYGYTYYGFYSIDIESKYLGLLEGKLIPDQRRVTAFNMEENYSAYGLIAYTKMANDISKDNDITEYCTIIIGNRK